MTKVKICGLTTADAVIATVQAQADFIGFVFAPSKRQITVEKACQLAKLIPAEIAKVGVFVNAESAFIKDIAAAVPLDYIQLHGDETPAFIAELAPLKTIKAFSVKTQADVERAASYDVDYYLFDTPGVEYEGGSGKTFDWSIIEGLPKKAQNIILAGGLHSANIEQAIERTAPAVVDVSSGVETNGKKDVEKIKQFIKKAQNGVHKQ